MGEQVGGRARVDQWVHTQAWRWSGDSCSPSRQPQYNLGMRTPETADKRDLEFFDGSFWPKTVELMLAILSANYMEISQFPYNLCVQTN